MQIFVSPIINFKTQFCLKAILPHFFRVDNHVIMGRLVLVMPLLDSLAPLVPSLVSDYKMLICLPLPKQFMFHTAQKLITIGFKNFEGSRKGEYVLFLWNYKRNSNLSVFITRFWHCASFATSF